MNQNPQDFPQNGSAEQPEATPAAASDFPQAQAYVPPQDFPGAPMPNANYPYPQGNLPPFAYMNRTPAQLIPSTPIKALSITGLFLLVAVALGLIVNAKLTFSIETEGFIVTNTTNLLLMALLVSFITALVVFSLEALIMWGISKLLKTEHPLSYSESLLWILLSLAPFALVAFIFTAMGQAGTFLENPIFHLTSIVMVLINTALFLKVAKASPKRVIIVAVLLILPSLIQMLL